MLDTFSLVDLATSSVLWVREVGLKRAAISGERIGG
jgi:hypothetical protein